MHRVLRTAALFIVLAGYAAAIEPFVIFPLNAASQMIELVGLRPAPAVATPATYPGTTVTSQRL